MSFWDDWSDLKKWTMGIISALLIAAVIGFVRWFVRKNSSITIQRVSFTAKSDDIFAIQSEFKGFAEILGSQMRVEVKHAKISYPARSQGYNGPRRIVDLRVSLVESFDESWRPIRQSSLLEIGREVQAGDTVMLDPFELTMSMHGLESLSGSWLVFDINSTIPGDPEVGSSHAHSRAGLFAD